MDKYDNLIRISAKKYNVPFNLIKSIIRVESNFSPSAKRYESRINDSSWGLMQILLGTAKWLTGNKSLTSNELVKPEINIEIGTRYIKKQLDRYKGDIDKAIAAYNAGTAFIKNGKFVNQVYVDRVNKFLKEYSSTGIGLGLILTLGLLILYISKR